jgi:hypothetical protein
MIDRGHAPMSQEFFLSCMKKGILKKDTLLRFAFF